MGVGDLRTQRIKQSSGVVGMTLFNGSQVVSTGLVYCKIQCEETINIFGKIKQETNAGIKS